MKPAIRKLGSSVPRGNVFEDLDKLPSPTIVAGKPAGISMPPEARLQAEKPRRDEEVPQDSPLRFMVKPAIFGGLAVVALAAFLL